MTVQTFTDQLVLVACYKCHIRFGITQATYDALHRNGEEFWCPSGHRQWYGESAEEKLKKQLAREKRLHGFTEATLTATRDQLQSTEYSRRAEKAAKTRLKNRIAAGVCPCCNRQFQNLHRHMAGQHPDFTEPKDT